MKFCLNCAAGQHGICDFLDCRCPLDGCVASRVRLARSESARIRALKARGNSGRVTVKVPADIEQHPKTAIVGSYWSFPA